MGLTCKIFGISAFVLFFYFEFISYWILPLTWYQQPDCSAPNCKKLLLVADPQIVGPEWNNFFIDWIAVFDSDRYIKRTFTRAFNYVKPDVTVFLGDLMDQAYMASHSEYVSYINRLQNIFELSRLSRQNKIVICPGDNDVGGIDEDLKPSSVYRFDKTFNLTVDSTIIDFIEFCNANLMTFQLQPSKKINEDFLRIALSHVPLVPKKSYFLNEVVKKIRPHLIFSGHSHRSQHYITYENDLWKSKHTKIPFEDNKSKVLQFQKGLIHEIIVPTCSYRMGVDNMGYGAAYIYKDEMEMKYNVIWLPNRFCQLFIYLGIATLVILRELVKLLRKVQRNWNIKSLNKPYTSVL